MYDSMMDRTFDLMIDIARARGNRMLVWCMEHGVFDEYSYEDRKIIRQRIVSGK